MIQDYKNSSPSAESECKKRRVFLSFKWKQDSVVREVTFRPKAFWLWKNAGVVKNGPFVNGQRDRISQIPR